MPRHNILYLVEHNIDDTKNTDNRLIVLYDESNETYYCYGTRKRVKNGGLNNEKYIDYKISFSVEKVELLLKWIGLINNNFFDLYTVEMHQITMDEGEYSDLDFTSVNKNISRYSEIFAYDKIRETESSIFEKLDILQSSVNF